jgi:hypothetical protein
LRNLSKGSIQEILFKAVFAVHNEFY